jgi:hypothetical protein
MLPKVLFYGLDYIEVSLRFDRDTGRQNSLNQFIENIASIFETRPGKNVNFLDRSWTVKHTGKAYRRYLSCTDGFQIYLDNRHDPGASASIKIVLGKPLLKGLPCLLWESPISSTQELINLFKEKYDGIEEQVSQVHLCCHFTNWIPTLKDRPHFMSRFKGQSDFDNEKIDDVYAISSLIFGTRGKKKVKGVKAIIYDVNNRVADDLQSFHPYEYYPDFFHEGDSSWNLEFKVYRQTLRERGIETLADLDEKNAALWVHLTKNRLRLLEENKKSRKKSWSTDKRWEVLQNAYGEGIMPLKKVRAMANRMPLDRKIKRIRTEILGFMIDAEWWNMSLDERQEKFIGLMEDDWFTTKAMETYLSKRDLQKPI